MSCRGSASVSTHTTDVCEGTANASGACVRNQLTRQGAQDGCCNVGSFDEAELSTLDECGQSGGSNTAPCHGREIRASKVAQTSGSSDLVVIAPRNHASEVTDQTTGESNAPGVAPQLLRRVTSSLEVRSNDFDAHAAGCHAPVVDERGLGGALSNNGPPSTAPPDPGCSCQDDRSAAMQEPENAVTNLLSVKLQDAGGRREVAHAAAHFSSLHIAAQGEGPGSHTAVASSHPHPTQPTGGDFVHADASSRHKPSIRVRKNTKELIRKRSRSSDTADSTPRPLAIDTQEDSDGTSSSTATSPGPASPEALPPSKQVPRRQSLLSSAIRRAASSAVLSSLHDADDDVDVAQALRDGIVRDEDVNLYGWRTRWQGLRHMEKHSESSPADAPAVLALRKSSRKDSGSRSKPRPLRRIETCPKSLTDHPELVKPQFRKKNIRPFHEVYKLGRVVGTGGFAVVRQCTHRVTGEEFAVKLLTVVPDGVEEAEREVTHRMMVDELQMMMELSHDNIVRLKEFFFDEGVCCIVMQLLEGEDLMDHLHEDGHSQADVKIVMQRLLDAISHMHDHGISHRDLKLENLVLSKPGDLTTVTIVDFGLAKAARARQEMKGVVGTTHYCAPEILLGRPYTPVVDSWSLGVVMYLLLTGEYPFNHEDEDELEDLIIDKEPSYDGALWAGISPEAMDLVKGLLEKNPVYRLTPQEALEHAWFTGHAFHDSHTLKHVHKRMEYIRANKNLLVRQFKRGEWIVRRGERCARQQEAYLMVTGEAQVLLWQPENNLAGPDGFVQLGVRRPGNFVGAMSVHFDERAESPAAQKSLSPHALQTASSSGSGHLASSWSSQRAWSPSNWAASAASSHARCAAGSSGANDAPKCDDNAGRALRVVFMLLRVMHRWIGRRRVISVRALTDVSVLVLSHDDMVWAVEHDYRLCSELSQALKKRRLVIKSQETVVRGKGKAKSNAMPKASVIF